MVGIVAYGGYIPSLRLNRKLVADAWGRNSVGGERSVANNDEDSVTMAVEAAINCLHDRKREEIEGLFFASNHGALSRKDEFDLGCNGLGFEARGSDRRFCQFDA